MRFSAKYMLIGAVVVFLTGLAAPISSRTTLIIDRDGSWINPVKVIRTLIVRLLDDLTVPHP